MTEICVSLCECVSVNDGTHTVQLNWSALYGVVRLPGGGIEDGRWRVIECFQWYAPSVSESYKGVNKVKLTYEKTTVGEKKESDYRGCRTGKILLYAHIGRLRSPDHKKKKYQTPPKVRNNITYTSGVSNSIHQRSQKKK